MHKSSLNFDSHGSSQLAEKCMTDCSHAARWRTHMNLYHHSFDSAGTLGVHWPEHAKPYWTSFTGIAKKQVEPEDEVQCMDGCRSFKSCTTHDEEVKILPGDVEVGTAPWLMPDPNDWKNPHNRQPTNTACIQQCKKLSTCRFGTYLTAGYAYISIICLTDVQCLITGGRRGECWLSAQSAEETQSCGEPCQSFELLSRAPHLVPEA